MIADSALPILVSALQRQAGHSTALAWRDGLSASLLQLAADHGMWGVLDRHWPHGEDLPPEAARARFAVSAMAARNAKRNLDLKQDALHLAASIADAGYRAVFLKGAAFLAEDSDAAPWRVMADIDLLVAPQSAQAVYDLLLAHGYSATEAPDRYREPDHQHLSPLQAPGSGHSVELHTRLVWDASRNPVPTDDLLASARPATEHTPQMLIASPGHRMAHLVAHAQIGDRNYAARQIVLKDIADVTALAPRIQDWEAIGAAFAKAGTTPEWLGFLAAVKMILGSPVHGIPVNTRSGEAWARQAMASLQAPERGRNRLLLHLVADYARRVVRDPRNLGLAIRTLIDPQRRAGFFGTHYRRWRR